MLAGTTRVWFWYATISSSTYPWLVYTGTTARIRTPEGMSDVFYNIRSLSRLYTHSCAFLLCNWLVHATLFWLFWSWRWKFPSHRHQLRWWRSPFYLWSYEMGLRFSKFRGTSRRYGPPHKLAKTKIQNIGTGDAPRTVHIDNQAVETVSKFTYLGSDINSEGYSYPEVHRRLCSIAGSIMAQLDNVWRQQRLRLSTKLRIYTSLVQSVVLYGSETWTLRKVDSDRIQSFYAGTASYSWY